MEELKTYTITLDDGTALTDLRLNGNNYVSETEVTEEMFEDNLMNVTISDGEHEETMSNAELIRIAHYSDGWYFILREIPADVQEKRDILASIAELEDAMCEADAANEEWKAGIEDALCEIDSAESEG